MSETLNICCGRNNRGVAVLGETLLMSTLDAHLVAVDARTGSLKWDAEVADPAKGYSKTAAPLIVKDKVVTGIAGGEYGIRGFVDAYDAETGERAWWTYTIPGPDHPDNKSWSGDSWRTGGAPTWITGSYDPTLNIIYWGTGNSGPDYGGDVRIGDNLYSDSVIALNGDTGEIVWHFQFTPHDVHDWDAIQIPVLVDAEFDGARRKLMLWANRNAFFYVLDRATGEFLLGEPFARQDLALGLDEKGRPVLAPGKLPTVEGTVVAPTVVGATNWWSPSYSPRTGCFTLFRSTARQSTSSNRRSIKRGNPSVVGGRGRWLRTRSTRVMSVPSTRKPATSSGSFRSHRPVGQVCFRRLAISSSVGRLTAMSLRSTQSAVRRCGTSRLERGFKPLRSATWLPTSSTYRSLLETSCLRLAWRTD